MKVLHIVGLKNNGKTTLVTELLEELTQRGLQVGSIKHCGHPHELDTPGRDSFRHRQAGAVPVGIITPELLVVYRPNPGSEKLYDSFRESFADCDLVLIEGYMEGSGPKLEVWRKEIDAQPMAAEDNPDLVGLVTDDHVEVDLPVWPRGDVKNLADQVIELAREL